MGGELANANFWVALAGVALAVMVQGGGGAFFMGRLFERSRATGVRLDKLEADNATDDGKAGALNLAVARLQVEMEHANKALDAINAKLK